MPDLDFTPSGEFIELHQLLKVTGLVDSGGAGKALVASGAVAVDGRQELRKTAKIRPGQSVMWATCASACCAEPRLFPTNPRRPSAPRPPAAA